MSSTSVEGSISMESVDRSCGWVKMLEIFTDDIDDDNDVLETRAGECLRSWHKPEPEDLTAYATFREHVISNMTLAPAPIVASPHQSKVSSNEYLF